MDIKQLNKKAKEILLKHKIRVDIGQGYELAVPKETIIASTSGSFHSSGDKIQIVTTRGLLAEFIYCGPARATLNDKDKCFPELIKAAESISYNTKTKDNFKLARKNLTKKWYDMLVVAAEERESLDNLAQ